MLRRGARVAAAALAVLALALLAGAGGPGGDQLKLSERIAVSAHPVPHFQRDDARVSRFGPLEFLGGLELGSAHRNFGGLSGFRMTGAETFLAVTDAGDWLSGRIEERDGAPLAVRDAAISPMLVGGDRPRAKDAGLWDAESLAIVDGVPFVGIERDHTVLAFKNTAIDGSSYGVPLPLPAFVKHWPDNRGIEALGVMPSGGLYAGRLIGLSERSGGRDEPTEGFVMGRDGAEPFRFRLKRSEGFDVTDLDFLPSGDLVVLERYFSPLRGVAMRLRRVRTAAIAPEATVEGEVLMNAHGAAFHVDNMEGLSIHRNARGETIFTLVSDDNFSIAQRTLLLRFRWMGD